MGNWQTIVDRSPAVAPNSFVRFNVIDNLDGTCTVYLQDRPNPDTVSTPGAVLANGLRVVGSAAGTVTGNGTTNQVVKWTDGPGSVIGDSLISDDGTNLEVVTTGSIDFDTTGNFRGGDVSVSGNGTRFTVDDTNQVINIEAPGGIARMGDAASSGNDTLITVNDAAQTIALVAANGVTINGEPATSGDGTTNAIPKYTNGAAGVLGDSRITDDDTTITLTSDSTRITGPVGIFAAPAANRVLDITNLTYVSAAATTLINVLVADATGNSLIGQSLTISGNGNVTGLVATAIFGGTSTSLLTGLNFTVSVASGKTINTATLANQGFVNNQGTLNGTTTCINGSLSQLGGGSSVLLARLVRAGLSATAGTVTQVHGLSVMGWTLGATITGSDGLFIDNSIPNTLAGHFAIRSLSTAPSLITGDLTVSALLNLGSTPVTINDAAGKILSAALNTVAIAQGGTNSTTALNNDRIMVSSGGAIVEAAALTNGQLLIGSTGAAPVAATLTEGANISITEGAGSITIATAGASGTFTSQDGKTITVADGVITSIV